MEFDVAKNSSGPAGLDRGEEAVQAFPMPMRHHYWHKNIHAPFVGAIVDVTEMIAFLGELLPR